MKILGEKSLSAVIRIFLIILLVLCTLVILTGAVIVIKDLNFYINTNLGRSLLLMYISTIPAEVLIIQFIGIFKSLKIANIFDININTNFLISAVVAAVTVGSKAAGKVIGQEHSTEIVHIVGKMLNKFIK